MRKLFIFNLLSTLIVFSGCTKEPVDNSPIIVLTAEPNPVNFLGSTNLSWSCSNVTECTLNGQSVSLNSNLYILNLKSDTTFVITCSGPNGNISKSITIKVGEKGQYFRILDILTSGRWAISQTRVLGLPPAKNDEWTIYNDNNMGNWDSYVFSMDRFYSNLSYIIVISGYLAKDNLPFVLSQNCKNFQMTLSYENGNKYLSNREIMSISNDSLVLYSENQGWAWSGTGGSGSGYFPTITKYIHYKAYDNIITTNDSKSDVYKILTNGSWKYDKTESRENGNFWYYSYNMVNKDVSWKFGENADYFGFINGVLVTKSKWYLIENNNKIFYTSWGFRDILLLTDRQLVVQETRPPHPSGNIYTDLTYFIKE